jgi:hypothetical protein
MDQDEYTYSVSAATRLSFSKISREIQNIVFSQISREIIFEKFEKFEKTD